jgi:hypothetical protein
VSSASAVEISSTGEEKAAEEKFCPDIAALFLVSRRQEQPQSSGHVWLIALSHASDSLMPQLHLRLGARCARPPPASAHNFLN